MLSIDQVRDAYARLGGMLQDLTSEYVSVPEQDLTEHTANMEALRTARACLQDELPPPMDQPDRTLRTARATVIAAARMVVIVREDRPEDLPRHLDELEAAIHYHDAIRP
jgi:hypothetical protein